MYIKKIVKSTKEISLIFVCHFYSRTETEIICENTYLCHVRHAVAVCVKCPTATPSEFTREHSPSVEDGA